MLSATHVPGAYEDFVRFVVPELERRGLFRKEFAGTTLRENLGLLGALSGDGAGTLRAGGLVTEGRALGGGPV